MFALHKDSIERTFHDPFIINGYRKPNMTAKDCLRSTLVYNCNETVNVWSHFIPFVYFFVNFCYYCTKEYSTTDPFYWPFVAYYNGAQGFCLMSALAHTFNSMSAKARNICFSLDYAAISIYTVGAGQAFFFYSRPIDPPVKMFRHSMLFSFGSVLFSIATTVQCCLTRHKSYSSRYVIRTVSCVVPFLWNTSPFLFRLTMCHDGFDSTSPTRVFFFCHTFVYILAAFINAAKIPERYFPGVFCVVGQSHHWMHILTAFGAAIQLEGVRLDMVNRRNMLSKQIDQSDSINSYLYMAVAVVVNFTLAVWLGYNTPTEVLKLDKKEMETGVNGDAKKKD